MKKNDNLKPVGEADMHTGTEAWNIAQYFTGFSIALPLKELNDLEDIARFGTLRMDDDLVMSDDQVDRRRADAVRRYWQKLKQIVSDTMFKVKKNDRLEALDFYKEVLEQEQFFDGLLSIQTNQVENDDKIKVNEEFLKILLDKLVKIKHEYLFILDRTGLIFKESDEVDLDKITNEFVLGG